MTREQFEKHKTEQIEKLKQWEERRIAKTLDAVFETFLIIPRTQILTERDEDK